MDGLIIRDGTEPGASGGLEFDLREVLTALGDAAARSRWTCRNFEYVSRDERNVEILDRSVLSGQPVAGTDLINGINDLIQVINGECEAIDEGGRVWAIVRAVDSSWWEVWSDDPLVLAAVRAKFRTTQTVSDNSVGGKT